MRAGETLSSSMPAPISRTQLAIEAERVLDEVVRSDREKVSDGGDLSRLLGRFWRLDHRAELRRRAAPVDLEQRLVEQRACSLELARTLDERNHDSKLRFPAGAQDGANLLEERRRLSQSKREAALLDPVQERRRLVRPEVERPHGRRTTVEDSERRLEHLQMLLERRPLWRLQERQLGAEQPDTVRTGIQPSLDLARRHRVAEQAHRVPVGCD